MIFLGDIAHPFETAPAWARMPLPWAPQAAIANLEGILVTDARPYISERRLFNHASIVGALKALQVEAVCLANNHITDIPGQLQATKDTLQAHGIASCGAGPTRGAAAAPVILQERGKQVVILAFGWEVIETKAATGTQPGANPLRPAWIFEQLRAQLAAGGSDVVIVMHWNYELEPYPQPAHRQLAMALIDAGAAAVIGHHPHCVGGVELYRGAPIAYSLGNWWLPQGAFFDGALQYGGEADLQLALEWSPGGKITCHWFSYDRAAQALHYQGGESFATGARIKELTPFDGMSHAAYVRWFARNRVKRKGLPIYKSYDSTVRNALKDRAVLLRRFAGRLLKYTGVRKLLGI